MDRGKLQQRLMVTFLEELEEHVRTFDQDLLALEKNPAEPERGPRLTSLFRTVHSLKGAARAVNVRLIESVCHRLEEIFTAVRDDKRPPGREVFALLFNAGDAIEEASMRLREQQDLSGSPLADVLTRLDASAKGAPVSVSAPALPPVGVPASAGSGGGEDRLNPGLQLPSPAPDVGQVEPPASGVTVRVAAERLDSLLDRVGELLVTQRRVESRAEDLTGLCASVDAWGREWQRLERSLGQVLRPGSADAAAAGLPRRVLQAVGQTGERLRQLAKDLERVTAALVVDNRQLGQVTGPLRDEIHHVRMLPFAEACSGLGRMVRDLAQATGKEVDLVVEGGDVEMDRSVLEGLKDPLRHLVRNAVDHGAEPPARRRAAGKPQRSKITVSAALRGSQVEVVVRDDGGGLNLEALREQVRRRKLPEPADEQELARVIFLPGLSTAPIITDVSGRGVGLDVVKSKLEGLHGTVDVASEPGRGTRFILRVPLTLTTLRAVLVSAAGQTYAFAGTSVERLLRVEPDEVRSVAGRPMLSLDGTPLPLAPLAGVLGLPDPPESPAGERLYVLILDTGERRLALAVDGFVAEQEVVVKNLGARVRQLRLVSGATLLPSGKIALVLNAAGVVRGALARAPAPAPTPGTEKQPAVRKRLLVVDDSVTTRTLEKSILEAAGYEVLTAVDGLAAWQLLQEQGADLLVSDVEMPRMDGFTLTERVRGSRPFAELPVVLVTARESDEDRARGVAVGADAYLVKSGFDQRNLLQTIGRLLG